MLTAKEACKRATEVLENAREKQLENLDSKIRYAVQNGQYSISEGGRLDQYTKTILEGMGYKVSIGSQYNEVFYTISWRE